MQRASRISWRRPGRHESLRAARSPDHTARATLSHEGGWQPRCHRTLATPEHLRCRCLGRLPCLDQAGRSPSGPGSIRVGVSHLPLPAQGRGIHPDGKAEMASLTRPRPSPYPQNTCTTLECHHAPIVFSTFHWPAPSASSRDRITPRQPLRPAAPRTHSDRGHASTDHGPNQVRSNTLIASRLSMAR